MSGDPSPPVPANALTAALREVLGPLARLAVARGVTHGALDELIKQALVDAADRSHTELPPHRRVSRITTATGIHRREVSRLIDDLRSGRGAQTATPARSHASELFSHWRTDPVYCDLRGSPAELPRTGPAPSFEQLAQCITRDVHPRSLLDELIRLGLAAHDKERDTVRLQREAFVPQGDEAGMVAVLGRNVGGHLAAAVDNVLLDNRQHFEQAIFAGGLSDASLAEFKLLLREQWQSLLAAMVPRLESLIERDARAEVGGAPATADTEGQAPAAAAAAAALAPARHQVRLGLYAHAQPELPRSGDSFES